MKTELTLEQKAQAILALVGWTDFSLKLREDGTWYVSDSLDIRGDGCLRGLCGSSQSPIGAIQDHWKQLTELEDGQYVVAKSGDRRRAVKWNGFMWADVNEELELERRKRKEAAL